MQLRKLSSRLQTLADVVADLIQNRAVVEVIDSCCDHGYLGQHLLKSHAGIRVSFVDVLQHLCDDVRSNLLRYNIADEHRANVLCKDASLLNLTGDLGITAPAKVLIIVAGVGGDISIQIIKGLLEQHAESAGLQLLFLVCPSNNMFRVRHALSRQCLSFIKEGFSADRGRAYEYVLVSQPLVKEAGLGASALAIPEVGDFWQLDSGVETDQYAYVQRLLSHYRRQQKSMCEGKGFDQAQVAEVSRAITLYAQLLNTASDEGQS